MSDKDAAASVYEKAVALRDFEISQLTQRNNFFMIFQGVLLAGVLQSDGGIPIASFLVCCAGFVVSILQTGMAAGAKYWQERWELGVERAEKLLLKQIKEDPGRRMFIHMFNVGSFKLRRRMRVRFLRQDRYSLINRLIISKPSVSRIPIYTGIGLSAVWLLLLMSTVRGNGFFWIPSWIVGFAPK
jgi:hypothetical protein